MIGKAPLYVQRKVTDESAKEIIAWAKEVGLKSILAPEELHLTVAYSKRPVEHRGLEGDENSVKVSVEEVTYLGDPGESALVLKIKDYPYLQKRWQYYCDQGAHWKYESYKPHVSLSWNPEPDLAIDPPTFQITLGPEIVEELDLGFQTDDIEDTKLSEQRSYLRLTVENTPVRMRRPQPGARRRYFDEAPPEDRSEDELANKRSKVLNRTDIGPNGTTDEQADVAYAEIRARWPEVYQFIKVDAPMAIDPVQTLNVLRRGISPAQFLAQFRGMVKQDTAKHYGKKHPQAEAAFKALNKLIR